MTNTSGNKPVMVRFAEKYGEKIGWLGWLMFLWLVRDIVRIMCANLLLIAVCTLIFLLVYDIIVTQLSKVKKND